jgi:glucosamine--fructose-6-phosphate aminotransferase (isomerizing)
LVTDKDLVFFLSQSGETLETIKAAKEVKGETISLTNTPRSTLTGLTDFTLLSHAGKEKAIPSTKSFTSMLAVLTLLAIENSKSNLKKNLIEIPSKIAKVLKDLTKPTKIIAKHFIREEMVDLIGDGINYPVTLEGALKLKETARMHAQGMPIGEYAHGHISLVTEGYPLIVVAIGKEKDRATRSFLKKLEELTPYAPIISMEPIEQIGGAPNLLVPRANEILSPFISVPIFQLFAYQTAIAKGLNPDKPRGLRKIVDRF